jgi:hypothetical protein
MIDIKKGSRVLRVSKCAYKDTFEKLGYKIINNSEEVVEKTTSTEKNKNQIKKQEQKEEQKEDVVTSENLNVNVIGENIENFDYKKDEEQKQEDKKEDSILEKVLQQKQNSSKRK